MHGPTDLQPIENEMGGGGGAKRRPNRNGGIRRIHNGDLPAKTRGGPHLRSSSNAVPYSYVNASSSGDPSRPIHLASSTVVAFVDPTPSSRTDAPVPAYDYGPSFAGGLGLGFQNEEEPEIQEVEEVEDDDDDDDDDGEEGEMEAGFISIGGVRVYADDTSSPEEDDVSGSGDEDSTGSEGESSDDDGDSSEIDEEMAEDYLHGIGGSGELMNSKWMAKRNLEEEFMGFDESTDDNDDDDDDDDEDERMLGPIDLMNESREYGMPQEVKEKRKKLGVRTRREKMEFRLSAALDDLMYEKNMLMVSGRRKKGMDELSQLSSSWPREGGRSRDYYGFSGIYSSI